MLTQLTNTVREQAWALVGATKVAVTGSKRHHYMRLLPDIEGPPRYNSSNQLLYRPDWFSPATDPSNADFIASLENAVLKAKVVQLFSLQNKRLIL
jgi:hypothetical protein